MPCRRLGPPAFFLPFPLCLFYCFVYKKKTLLANLNLQLTLMLMGNHLVQKLQQILVPIFILLFYITLLHFEYGGWWMVGIEKRDLNDINMRRSGMGVRFEQSC
jgi:hypothetical protein